ncbi:MAG TPA: hypothetical protein DF613_12940 [Lachnospiraceae bacterium]|nr:hypothetical protein [Lachnospiraceae bacterium]
MGETKKNVFQELALSVWDFKSYGTFIRNRGVKVFGFSALLIGIYLLISTVFMTMQVAEMVTVFRDEVLAEMPEFVLEDGILTMDETFEVEEQDIFVHINTEEYWSNEEIEDIFSNYSSVIILDKAGVILQSDGEQQVIDYADLQEALGGERYTQDDLAALVQEFLPYLYIVIGIVFLFMGLGSIITFSLRILVVSLIVLILVNIMKMRLSYGEIFKLSVYTRTIPVLIRLVLRIANISFPFFWIVDLAVSGVYGYLALRAIQGQIQPPYHDSWNQPQPPYQGQGNRYQPPYQGPGSPYQSPYNGPGQNL